MGAKFVVDGLHNGLAQVESALSAYIQAQKDCCAHYGIPVLDQYHLQGVNRFNCKEFYKKDLLHMTEEGYRRIAPVQAAFLANGR